MLRFISDLLLWLSPVLSFRLLAKQDLSASEDAFAWQSTGDDPFFSLKRKGAFPKGWYMLSLQLTSNASYLNSKIYIDFGEGIQEDRGIGLTLLSGKVVKRICYFPSKPVSIRFDPAERPCQFSVDKLQLSKLSRHYARKLMIKKINARGGQGQYAKMPALELLAAYNACFLSTKNTISYSQWQKNHEPKLFDKVDIAEQMLTLTKWPIISVLLATYHSDIGYLRSCIDSVIAQSYPHWQLCIADDGSADSAVKSVLSQYAQSDARIEVLFREQNGHISAASNSALSLARGEFIALLDHDDCLAEHALFFVAKSINEQENLKLIYSDEDKIDEQGIRFEPHFKSDWNPDLFYSHNYITHLCVISRAIVNSIGGFRIGVEGSQDYDLVLRTVAVISEQEINHIPHVLYHWRAINGSTALSSKQKSYTSEAGLKALKNYFLGRKIPVAAELQNLANCFRVIWPMPEHRPLVSLLIPTRDGYQLLKQCIDSIQSKTTYSNYEILILNNQSRCPRTLTYFEKLSKSKQIHIIDYDQPFNFSKINNLGVEHAQGSLIGLINNDIEVINPDWLDEMVRQASRPDIGCVGAKLFYPNGSIQHAGVVLGIGGVAGHAHKHFSNHHHGYFSRLSLVQNFSAVTAAALLVRKSVYLEVGGLEESLKIAFNDVDFCLKVRTSGYRNLWTPYAELYHHESVSRGYEDTPEKQQRFSSEVTFMKKKWGKELDADPYYSPNLTLLHEDLSYRV
jgi:GT2 family glycosyltransferase